MTTTAACESCGSDRLVLACPFGCPVETYDTDTTVCAECREAVAPVYRCEECGEVAGVELEQKRERASNAFQAWDGGFAENH